MQTCRPDNAAVESLADTRSWLFRLLILLAWLWAFTFAAKGALFQASLYLLPLLTLGLMSRLCQQVAISLRGYWVAVVLLLAPVAIADVHLLMAGEKPQFVFEVWWRLLVFPFCLGLLVSRNGLIGRYLMPVFLFSCVVHLMIATVMEMTGSGHWEGRFSGVIFNPNQFGLLMGAGMLCCMPGVVAGRRGWQLLAILLFAGCLLSGSRGAVAGALMGAAVYGLGSGGGQVRKWLSHGLLGAAVSLLLAALVLVLLSVLGNDLSEFNRYLNPTDSPVRYQIWQHYLANWQQSPWLGMAMTEASKPVLDGTRFYPHNQYLEILVMSGVFGLLCFALFILWTVRYLYSHHRPRMALPLALSAMMLLFCFFSSSLYFSEVLQGLVALMVVYVVGGDGGRMAPVNEVEVNRQ